MKVTGCGISLSPDKFMLSMMPDGIVLEHEGPRPEYIFREVYHEGGYCAAFCLKDMPAGHHVVCREINLAEILSLNEAAR